VAARWKPAAKLRALEGALDLVGGDYVMALVPTGWEDTGAVTTLADLTEIDDTGYARQPCTWQAPALDGSGTARSVFDDATFGPMLADQVVGGWYIADLADDDASASLLFYGSLDDVAVVLGDELLGASPLSGAVVLA
jgi:hypothetical protein